MDEYGPHDLGVDDRALHRIHLTDGKDSWAHHLDQLLQTMDLDSHLVAEPVQTPRKVIEEPVMVDLSVVGVM